MKELMQNNNDKCCVDHIFIDLLLHRSCFFDDKNFSICLDDKNFFVAIFQIFDVQVVYPMKNQYFSDSNGLKKLRQQLKQQ